MDCAAVYAEGGTKTSSAYDDEYDEDGNLLPAAREMCVLPFPYEDVLLQGETKELRLYEDRYVLLQFFFPYYGALFETQLNKYTSSSLLKKTALSNSLKNACPNTAEW